MNLIYLVLLLLLFLAVLIFVEALRVKFIFDSDRANINLSFLWVYPLLKVMYEIEGSTLMLSVYIFKLKVYKGAVKAKAKKNKTGGMELVKLANPKDVHVSAFYGFKNPLVTGVACGAINILSKYINIDSLRLCPDFLAVDDYIYLDADAKVNVASTMINMAKQKMKK